jgi:N-acetylneuraminic acid mutarotase
LGSGLSTVEEYEPETNSWTTKTRMPTARYLLSSSAVNDKIYVIGGSVLSWPWPACSKLEEYDPSSDQPTSIRNPSWTKKPTEFLLHQNYCNPFYPETRISYNISKHAHVLSFF